MRRDSSVLTGVTRREFLAGSLVAASWTALGAAWPIMGQPPPVSAGPGAPELVDDLVAANANGRSQYLERFIHGEVYRARPDVRAVVHAHAASIVPFGVSTVPLRPVFHMAALIGDSVPIFDIRKTAGMTNMLVIDSARGRALAQALASKPAVLMRGHGVTVVGRSLPFAVGRSIYLELNARVQLQAIALGGPVTYLDPAEAQKVMDAGENGSYERPWELWKRKALA